MLRVQDFLPSNNFGAPNQGLVIGTQFGPDGALYMTKFPVSCCRIALDSGDGEPLVRIKFNVQDKCDEDTAGAHRLARARRRRGPEPGGLATTTRSSSPSTPPTTAAPGSTPPSTASTPASGRAYADPVDITTPGAHTVEYRTTDTFHNVSTVGNASFTIVAINDSAAPQTTLQINGAAPQPRYAAQVTLRLDAADPAGTGESSGVKSTEYTINGGTPVKLAPGDLPRTLVLPGSGEYAIDYHSVDHAGNAETTKQVKFKIEDGLELLSCTSAKVRHASTGPALNPAWEFLRPVDDRPAPAGRTALHRRPRPAARTARMGHDRSARHREERAPAGRPRRRPVAGHDHPRRRRPGALRGRGRRHRGRDHRLGVREPEQVQQVRALPRQLQRPDLRGQARAHRRRRQHPAEPTGTSAAPPTSSPRSPSA